MAGGLLKNREGGGAPVPMTDEDMLKLKQAAAKKVLKPAAPASAAPSTGGTSFSGLVQSGVDPASAMQKIMDDAQAINVADRAAGNVPPPNTDPRPKVDESALLTPELAKQVKAAKTAIGAGDTKGAAQAVMEAGKAVSLPGQTIAPTQAVGNVAAVAEGRNPVNTASPAGLWGGKVGMPTGAEPLDVIAETATPQQASAAATQAQKAAMAAIDLGLAQPPQSTATDGGSGASGDTLVETAGAPGTKPVASDGTSLAGGTGAGEPMTFLDLLSNPERFGAYKDVVLKALEAKYGPRILNIQQDLERSKLGMGRQINDAQRVIMDQANRRGLGLWGTTLHNQAQVAGRAMEQAQLNEQQTNQRMDALREARQNELLPMVRDLFTQDRDFQENVRRYGQDYAIRKAAADQALSLGESRLNAAELEQKAAQLEYDIANDPDIGTRAQKQQELNLIRSQISAQDALATQRSQPKEPSISDQRGSMRGLIVQAKQAGRTYEETVQAILDNAGELGGIGIQDALADVAAIYGVSRPGAGDSRTDTINTFTADMLQFQSQGRTYDQAKQALSAMVQAGELSGLTYAQALDVIDRLYGQGRYQSSGLGDILGQIGQ